MYFKQLNLVDDNIKKKRQNRQSRTFMVLFYTYTVKSYFMNIFCHNSSTKKGKASCKDFAGEKYVIAKFKTFCAFSGLGGLLNVSVITHQ